ncbi:hypothetical protein [Streptomyces sp. NPDC059460]|uniref:hypothetical protein n=1 Tax=Streptomyces sp. NPDC059460 TaxID=3346840 RepID=UPI00369BFDA7
MTVSPRAEKALREAMQRLFTGNAQQTDGALTKNNLYREAGVSRATMNRATAILAEWDAHSADSPVGTTHRQNNAEIAELRTKLRKNRDERRTLQDQLDAAATVIMTLLAENAALREQATKRSATVVPLPLGRAPATHE